MKHLSGFESFNEGKASKIAGAVGIALAAATGAGAHTHKSNKDKEATEYVVPAGRKTIIEDLQQCLRDCKVKYKKTPEFEDAKDVKEYIDYLNELCDKNDVGLRVKSHKKVAKN